jgi:Flp pilus assembly protein TadD
MLLGGGTLQALANFRESVRGDDSFAPAWINLGILHRRDGYTEYAEAAYLRALEIDQYNLVAMSNLANLYEEERLTELAETYRSRVRSHRMNNPYYRYHLAQNAVIEGDYKTAIDHLKFAIRKKEDEDRFYFLMSLSYLLSGDEESAQSWMKQAEDLAGEDADRKRYRYKIELLIRQEPGI